MINLALLGNWFAGARQKLWTEDGLCYCIVLRSAEPDGEDDADQRTAYNQPMLELAYAIALPAVAAAMLFYVDASGGGTVLLR